MFQQTLGMKQELTASIVFSSMTVFDMFQNLLHVSFYYVNSLITGRVSLDRVNDFLTNVIVEHLCVPSFTDILHRLNC